MLPTRRVYLVDTPVRLVSTEITREKFRRKGSREDPRVQRRGAHLRLDRARIAGMVLISDFDDFYQRAAALFRADPARVRYVVKYRHCDGSVVFKVTSDETCVSFASVEASDLKKLEQLNLLFLSNAG